ncbi:MAG: tRNA-dihydrouridine synthase C [Alteromonadaceae bacterium]|jgi:tRNA-dihydrouridine synthase C
MKITLAPMEGVVDHLMREMLTHIGGFDLCVTEFMRVVDQLYPPSVFHRICPELSQQGKTASGTPVRIQLLGQDPNWLAENAVRAVALGSSGLDLNFGCPAKMVNRSKGGAALLKEPETLYQIVKAVRQAVPSEHQVSAKIRLGFDDKLLAIENAQAIEEAGASQLVVHARTKAEGYNPPAWWDWIGKIREQTSIDIVSNGEIWNHQDALLCQQQSGCQDMMVGRGVLAMPNLAMVIKDGIQPMHWQSVMSLLVKYSGYELYGDKGVYYPNRIKQWLKFLSRQYPEAKALFTRVRTLKSAEDILKMIKDVDSCVIPN